MKIFIQNGLSMCIPIIFYGEQVFTIYLMIKSWLNSNAFNHKRTLYIVFQIITYINKNVKFTSKVWQANYNKVLFIYL